MDSKRGENWKPYDRLTKVVARSENAARAKDSGFVYFIACGPYIKIGHSQDHPRQRMRTMATGNPYPCTLIGMLEAGWVREREIQEQFAGQRHALEWFHSSEALLAFIAEACGDWSRLDSTKRVRMSQWERLAREHGVARLLGYER